MAPCAFDTVDLPTFVGEVAGIDALQIPALGVTAAMLSLRRRPDAGVSGD